MRFSKILRNICLIFLSAVTACIYPLTAAALDPAFAPSDSYSESKYCSALRDVKLTGDKRTDIVNIALSQAGYHEGGGTGDLSGDSTSSANYTEYGRCFGTASDQWCAMFIWWCAAQARISENIIPHTEWAKRMTYGCPSYPVGRTDPAAGDIAFVDNNGDSLEDHVALITGVRDDRIYTVEGNISNRVVTRSYTMSGKCTGGSGVILFIGKPDYDHNGASHSRTDNYIVIASEKALARQSIDGSGGTFDVYSGERYLLLNIVNRGGTDWYMFEVGQHAYWISSADARRIEPAPTTTTQPITTSTTAPTTTVITTASTSTTQETTTTAPQYYSTSDSDWEVLIDDELPPPIIVDQGDEKDPALPDYVWPFAFIIVAIIIVFALLVYFTVRK